MSQSVKICFVMPKAYPLFNPKISSIFGGAEVDIYLLSKELAKDNNFSVNCIVADYGQSKNEEHNNVLIENGFSFNDNPIKSALSLWKSLKKTDADIYIAKTSSMGVPFVKFFCYLNKKKFVYRTASQREANGEYLKAHPIIGRLFVASLRRANLVLCQNNTDKQNLEQNYKIKSTIISNGHSIPVAQHRNQEYTLWVGRSAGVKCPERFITLAQEFPDQKFVMICQKATGDNNYENLQQRASTIENLNFIPRVPFEEIEDYFKNATFFVNTSDSEGFPNTFIQANKWAAPILSYKVNPDDFLNEFNCGFCANGNWEKFAKQFNKLQDKQLNEELGNNGRDYVINKHDIVKIAEIYKQLFKELRN